MKSLYHLGTGQLEKAIRNLRHAENHRPGGLLIAEKIALKNMDAELERRADIAYCKANDC